MKVIQGPLDKHLHKLKREMRDVRGDGFCLLHSISGALYLDHDIFFQVDDLENMIMAYVRNNKEELQAFHTRDIEQEVIRFLTTKGYNSDIGDLILEMCVKALYITINLIMEGPQGEKHSRSFTAGPTASIIYIHFKYDRKHPVGNHYNPLILTKDGRRTSKTDHPYSKKLPTSSVPIPIPVPTIATRMTVKSLGKTGKGPKRKFSFKRTAPVSEVMDEGNDMPPTKRSATCESVRDVDVPAIIVSPISKDNANDEGNATVDLFANLALLATTATASVRGQEHTDIAKQSMNSNVAKSSGNIDNVENIVTKNVDVVPDNGDNAVTVDAIDSALSSGYFTSSPVTPAAFHVGTAKPCTPVKIQMESYLDEVSGKIVEIDVADSPNIAEQLQAVHSEVPVYSETTDDLQQMVSEGIDSPCSVPGSINSSQRSDSHEYGHGNSEDDAEVGTAALITPMNKEGNVPHGVIVIPSPPVSPIPYVGSSDNVIDLCTPEKLSQIVGDEDREFAENYIRSIMFPQVGEQVNEEPEGIPDVNATPQLFGMEPQVAPTRQEQPSEGLRKGDGFPEWMFFDKTPQTVQTTPDDIDGQQWYVMNATKETCNDLCTDRRYFEMRTTSRRGFHGKRKVGWCQGSSICVNDRCNFRLTNRTGEANRNHWTKKRETQEKQCSTCGFMASREPCGARKLTEMDYMQGLLTVMHVGNHKCTMKPPSFYRRNTCSQAMRSMAETCPPREMQTKMVREQMDKGDWKGACKAARDWTDMRLVGNLRSKMQQEKCSDGNSLEAVGILKEQTDQEDPYFIYRINDGRFNNGLNYVFKTSTEMAKLAIAMDCDGEGDNPLKDEIAYFDAIHTRVVGYKSIALWVLHPATHSLLRLCNMEMKSESTLNIAQFFELFNEILSQVKGEENYRFNPIKIMSDELAANKAALRQVFGEEFVNAKCISCSWHYKHDMRQHTSKITNEQDLKHIRELSASLCTIVSCSDYDAALVKLRDLALLYLDIGPWLEWWHARRKHIFPAYRGCGYSGLNMSEPGNSSWKRRKPLKLVDACSEDCCTILRQEEDLKMFFSHESRTVGKAPDTATTMAKNKKDQVARAHSYGTLMHNKAAMLREVEELRSPSNFTPKAGAKHRPPRKGNYGIQGRASGRGRARGKKGTATSPGRSSTAAATSLTQSVPLIPQDISAPHHVIHIPTTAATSSATKTCTVTSASATTPSTTAAPKTIAPKPAPTSAPTQIQGYVVIPQPAIDMQRGQSKQWSNLVTIAPKPRATLASHSQVARAVLGEPVTNFVEPLSTRIQKLPNNPPMLMAVGKLQIKRCQGCFQDIDGKQPPPHDLVFKNLGERTYIHPATKLQVKAISNCYYHLDIKCLRKKFPTTELRDYHCTDDEFTSLTGEHMVMLKTKGILQYILANKM